MIPCSMNFKVAFLLGDGYWLRLLFKVIVWSFWFFVKDCWEKFAVFCFTEEECQWLPFFQIDVFLAEGRHHDSDH